MGADKVKSKRFVGVYWRESDNPHKLHNGRRDRCFYYTFRDASGKQRLVKVGWASQGQSEQSAHTRRQEAITGATPPQFVSSDAHKNITLEEAFQQYIKWCRGERKNMKREEDRWKLHVEKQLGPYPLDALTIEMLNDRKGELVARGLSDESVKKVFNLIRTSINHCIEHGHWTGSNPIRKRSKFKMPKPQNKGERFFSEDEAKEILERLAKRSQQWHDMSLLSLRTGVRSTEIFRLTGADVDKAAGVIWVTAKGGKRQSVHADEDVFDMLLSYDRKPSEYIFQSRRGGRVRCVSKSFKRVINDMKLNAELEDNRKRSWFHTWRHTFASWLAQSGEVTLHELKELMRHEKIEMTERYAHLIPGHQKGKLSIIVSRLSKSGCKQEKAAA